MSPYVRTVKTASGATAVQVVHSMRAGKRDIEHVGSARDEVELAALKVVAAGRIHAGQGELDLGLGGDAGAGARAVVTGSRAARLWDAIAGVYRALGLDGAAGGDNVFRLLVAARIIEPTSKLDSLRVIDEAGVKPPSYATVKRALPVYATEAFRQKVSAALAEHAALGPASLVLYDVTVRHEALVVRAGVRDLCLASCRGRGFEAGGSLTGETSGRAGAAPTKPCRVGTVGRRERGERAGKAYARNRCHYLS